MTTTLATYNPLVGRRHPRRVQKLKTTRRPQRRTPRLTSEYLPRNAPIHIFEVNGEYGEKDPLDIAPKRHENDHDHYLNWLRARHVT